LQPIAARPLYPPAHYTARRPIIGSFLHLMTTKKTSEKTIFFLYGLDSHAQISTLLIMRFSLTRLENGLYRLFDYSCQWSGIYNRDGSFRHGQTSSIRYLNQIKEHQWI
jgi:hypothetical protein